MIFRTRFTLALVSLHLWIPTAFAESGVGYGRPPPPRVGWQAPLGAGLPLDLTVLNSAGDQVSLGSFFGKGPVMMMFGYNRCPMLCGEQQRGFLQAVAELEPETTAASSFLFFSIDEGEAQNLARESENTARRASGGQLRGIHFLRGNEESIGRLTAAVGFEWEHDARTDQFAHPAGVLVATADGRVSTVLLGVRFEARDFRLALNEASAGKLGSLQDAVLLLCYHYDPTKGGYGLAVSRILAGSSVLTLLALGVLLAWAQRRAKHTSETT